jgi:uncharacterized protein YjbI with pentapeptide repeats
MTSNHSRESMPWLVDFDDEGIEAFGEYDCSNFEGIEFVDARADNATFLECRFAQVSFERSDLSRSSWSDSIWSDLRLVATAFSQSHFRDLKVRGCLFAGADLSGSDLRRVTFEECKFEAANFRGAQISDVTFDNCALNDADFTDARIRKALFRQCAIKGVDLTNADFVDTDLRTSQLDIRRGHLRLAGTTIDIGQLLSVSVGLAQQLGIDVRNDE